MDAIDYLLTKLSEEVKQIQTSLGSGSAKDYAEYQYQCGKIRGLLVAEGQLLDLKKRMEDSDE